ncbi:MAG: cytochrome c maturation protein CcmE [Fimbriimonadaceae bacterium]
MLLKGPLVSAGVALLSVVGLAVVFVMNASPYATVKEALNQKSDGIHVVGEIVPGSLKQNLVERSIEFVLKDETGTMPVRYVGPPQANLKTTPKVVAIGSIQNGQLVSKQMLVKCPSKYEAEKKGG